MSSLRICSLGLLAIGSRASSADGTEHRSSLAVAAESVKRLVVRRGVAPPRIAANVAG